MAQEPNRGEMKADESAIGLWAPPDSMPGWSRGSTAVCFDDDEDDDNYDFDDFDDEDDDDSDGEDVYWDDDDEDDDDFLEDDNEDDAD